MAEGSKSKSRVYCGDPFRCHKKKVLKDKSFLFLTEEYTQERSPFVPELLNTWDNGERWICKLCVLRIKKTYDRMKPALDQLHSLSLDQPEIPEIEDDSDPDFTEVGVDKSVLITELLKIGIDGSDLNREYVSRKTVENIVEEISKWQTALVARVKAVAGRVEVVELSNAIDKPEECSYCASTFDGLERAFSLASSKEDKYRILTCVPYKFTIAQVSEKFECSQHMARKASKLKHEQGFFSCPPPKLGRKLDAKTVDLVKQFYLADENSRVDPSIRGTILVYDEECKERIPKAKRLILTSLSDLYAEFAKEHPLSKISISAFALQRPVWCYWPGRKGHHYSCTCITHENFNLMLIALKIKTECVQFLSALVCSIDNEECALGTCTICPNTAVIDEIFEKFSYAAVTFHYWGTMAGTFGINIHEKTEPLSAFRDRFEDYIPIILSHHFVMKKQIQFIDHVKTDILPRSNSALMQVDFAQNYAYIVQGAVQGYHWNNNQATLVPFVLTYYDQIKNQLQTMTYVVISDDLDHDAFTFNAFRAKVIAQMVQEGHNYDKLYYLSDGAGSQFKNKWNFVNLIHHEQDFKMSAEWHFHAASHGKSQCDAMDPSSSAFVD